MVHLLDRSGARVAIGARIAGLNRPLGSSSDQATFQQRAARIRPTGAETTPLAASGAIEQARRRARQHQQHAALEGAIVDA